jgi:hypothetical protein
MLKLSKRLQEHVNTLEVDDFTKVSIEEIDMYILNLSQALQFYANKNYDNGLVARMTLGQMSESDHKTYNFHAENTYNLESDSDKI